jgi:hypothetical protein
MPPKQQPVAKVSKAITKVPPQSPPAAQSPALAATTEHTAAVTQPDASDTDPLHTLIGELVSHPVIDDDGNIDDPRLGEVFTKLLNGIAKKPKDWAVAWNAMKIPLDKQVEALQAFLNLAFVRTDDPEKAPMVIAELAMMHKIKIRSVEEVLLVFGQNFDGVLAINEEAWQFYPKFLVQVFPKPAASGWGWSRVGWSFQSWWTFVEKCIQTLESPRAFEVIAQLLVLIQDREGTTIADIPAWSEGDRLTRVLTKLCELGSCDAGEVMEQLTNLGVVVPITSLDDE